MSATTVFETGAIFKLVDEFSGPGRRLLETLEAGQKAATELQLRLDKLGLGAVVSKVEGQWREIGAMTDKGVAGIVAKFDGIGREVEPAWAKVVGGAVGAFDKVGEAAGALQKDVTARFDATGTEAAKALRTGLETSASTMFSPVVGAARTAAAEVAGIMGEAGRSIDVAASRMRTVGPTAMAGLEERASLRTRTLAAHGVNNAHASGVHFGRMGTHIGGAHASMGGDGIVPAVAGGVILEILKKGVEEGWDMDHWASGFAGAGFSGSDISKAKRAAWANAGMNPNASAIDGMKNILELNKATGSLDESIELLPLFSKAEMAMQSVKAEGLHSKFTGGNQILNLAKGLEEMGYTTKGDTPEERQANIEKATNELIKTMVASRGLFDGNKLFAMTNNSGGAAQNWDLRFGTTIAPIIGDIMNHSKLGNADYMSLKSFQGGHITPDAVEGLIKYKMVDMTDVYQDQKGKWHLNANSNFAKGMESNLFSWSGRVLERLKANGFDINNQEFMNGIVNEIGSNKSNSMLMRAVLEPGTRKQIQKEIDLRDKVPDDVAGVLQKSDPVLKLDALHKKTSDFLAALGGPLVDPAIVALTKLTTGINALAQAAEAHPDITKGAAAAAGAAGVGLFGYGAGKMLGLFGGANAELTKAALMLQEAAVANGAKGGGGSPGGGGSGFWGKVGGALSVVGMAEWAKSLGANPLPTGVSGRDFLNFLDPNFGDMFLGKAGTFKTPAAYNREMRARMGGDGQDHTLDGVIVGSNDAGKKLGELKDRTGFVLTSFDGLDTGVKSLSTHSGGLDNAFKILEATAMGAARQLANVAMSGGAMGGGSGFMNASWGGGGGSGSPDISGAFRGSGPGIGHTFSAAEREANIRAYAAKIGINPDVAMAVAKSEGFGRFDGDHGTSFGDLQMHIGGGLGDTFRRATGLNPADPHNELALDRFALDQAKSGGWAPWHGAARIGVHGRYGMDYHGPVPTVTGPSPRKTVSPGSPAGGSGDHVEAAVHRALGGVKMEVAVVYDRQHEQHVAKFVTKHQVVANRFPRTGGGPDHHSHYSNMAGTPVTDTA